MFAITLRIECATSIEGGVVGLFDLEQAEASRTQRRLRVLRTSIGI